MLRRKIRDLFRSFYKPLTIDLAVRRREKLSVTYAVSSFCLFVYTTYLVIKMHDIPEFAEKSRVAVYESNKRVKPKFNKGNTQIGDENVADNENIQQKNIDNFTTTNL